MQISPNFEKLRFVLKPWIKPERSGYSVLNNPIRFILADVPFVDGVISMREKDMSLSEISANSFISDQRKIVWSGWLVVSEPFKKAILDCKNENDDDSSD